MSHRAMGSIDKACISGFLCRLCSEMHRTVIHIYGDQGKRLCLVEKINGYLPITISPTDPLPKTICTSCLRRVEQHYDLLMRLSRIKQERIHHGKKTTCIYYPEKIEFPINSRTQLCCNGAYNKLVGCKYSWLIFVRNEKNYNSMRRAYVANRRRHISFEISSPELTDDEGNATDNKKDNSKEKPPSSIAEQSTSFLSTNNLDFHIGSNNIAVANEFTNNGNIENLSQHND